jgi:hypothetical protein
MNTPANHSNGIVFIQNGRVFVIPRPRPATSELGKPGGYVEYGRAGQEAKGLVREMQEERGGRSLLDIARIHDENEDRMSTPPQQG